MRPLSRLRTWFRTGGRTIPSSLEGFSALSASDGYSLWADSYPPRPHNPLMEAEQAAVAPLLRLAVPARALDVGTGTGRYLPLLASAGARFVVGVDLSIAMLTKRLGDKPCICADACRLPFGDGTFDLVCASLMIGDVQDVAAWLQEASRVLAPGGRLVYSDFHPSWEVNRWRRTFQVRDGRKFEIAYFPHSIDEHLENIERSSLSVQAIREPRIPGFSAPVVVVFHAVKPGPLVSSRQNGPGGARWAPTLQSVRLYR